MRIDIFVKDMAFVVETGRPVGLALPVASAAEQLFRQGESAGLGAKDDSRITSILRVSLSQSAKVVEVA
jgi:3-hydroxyisobutyrate dehydrogenase